MQRISVSNNLSLSRIIQGFWRLDGWNMSAKELAHFMNECIERGVTTFDTAEIYAGTRCERMIGEAFAYDPSIRGRIELVSKCGIYLEDGFGYYDTTAERIRTSCREALQRLKTDHIDLYLIHREDPMLDPWDTAEGLRSLKADGLVREIGVSNFDPFKFDALQTAVGGELVTNQIEWNPVCFEHFRSGMMDYLSAHRIHPMIWSPLAGGRLFAGGDEACERAMKVISGIAERRGEEPAVIVYAWILMHPVLAMPISGSRNTERLDLAVRALDVKLERHEWYRIYAASGQQQIR